MWCGGVTRSNLFRELKKKCSKEDMKNLHLTSQRLKLFKTKNQREEAVRRFVAVLSSSENLMAQPEVVEFMKKDAFGIHWMNEMFEASPEEEVEAISDEE